eukprot:TRINITY_DN112552_c0_g1_i1.p1 TRINITY_DN112552_c0_g1~~TRINITY_DN112552_c0_g1_i1.p1  ORF type:complete len:365 (-),score=36.94 TRINITY_DN112552_c0_g1_i1:497-1591(-)
MRTFAVLVAQYALVRVDCALTRNSLDVRDFELFRELDAYHERNQDSRPAEVVVTALDRMITAAMIGKSLSSGEEVAAPSVTCPPAGAGLASFYQPQGKDLSRTGLERHHFMRHAVWAAKDDFCAQGFGLWTKGGGIRCPLTAAVIGTTVGLGYGQSVLDVGSGCGHYSKWFYKWFGARTIGIDFVDSAIIFARQVAEMRGVPATYCHFNVATEGLGFVDKESVHLALAVSVIHYLKTDTYRFQLEDTNQREGHLRPIDAPENRTRTPCLSLAQTEGTQCSVVRGMFRAIKVGGHVWIQHNGSYKGKWDPKLVWGTEYWRCCFASELRTRTVSLQEIDESLLFLTLPDADKTYSLVLRRLKSSDA